MTPHTSTRDHSLEDYGGPPPQNYERYFVPPIGRPLAAELVEAAALTTGERVVDLACGTGVVARLAAARVGAAGAVSGVDLNDGMLAVARSIPAEGAAIEWHQADAAATGLPDAAADVVLCQLGLQFFADRSGAVGEMRRLLARGGRIVISVAGPTPPIFEILQRALAERVSPGAAGFIATVFSLNETAELERLLERAGFDEVAVERREHRLQLPPPAAFLWQYVSSTPLAPVLRGVDDGARARLAHDVVPRWEPFVADDGSMVMDVDVLLATARGPGGD